MEEIWKPIIGYEGLYEISNFSRIKSLKRVTIRKFEAGYTSRLFIRERILKPVISGNKYGYYRVNLSGKLISVHRLVALNFIENPKELPVVNHKDSNKLNNSISNLEWMTYSENTQHAFDNGAFDHVNMASRCKKVIDEHGNIYSSLKEAYLKNHTHKYKWYKTFILNVSKGKLKYTAI